MKTKKTQEGDVELLIPDLEEYKNIGNAPVFYNPKMEMDRTLSIEVIKTFFKNKKPVLLDGLSATGARALRYKKEIDSDVRANDADPEAVDLIEKNAELNDLEVVTSNQDANEVMVSEEKFDYIDIDPFGSPAPFMNNVFKGVMRKKSLVGITATDLGALSGHYPKACFRRYGTICKANPFEHEIGIRNLIYSFYKSGAVNGFTVDPVICYWNRHYYRCFFEVKKSKAGINRNMDNIGYLMFCRSCGRRRKTKIFKERRKKCVCGEKITSLGPTWLGYLGDEEFLDKVDFYEPLFRKFKKEVKVKDLYYDIHWISGALGATPKKRSFFIENLREYGYKSYETIFTGHGFRTNAPQEKVLELFKKD